MIDIILHPVTVFTVGCFFGIFLFSLLFGRDEYAGSYIYVPENSDVYVKVYPKQGDENGKVHSEP